ncbi:hypothetical protein PR003_g2896 [Phytophthora rubi]|uniref:DUF6570 domain-containing protein n=1 Tax=Phytophthora rubi TaxID=129364 RepID=A0A6A4FRJ8_9STRA|nr:hypothetical protein PR003_g2896 [Phytophthora rubi]
MKKPRKAKRCAKAARRMLNVVAVATVTAKQAEGNPHSVEELESTREAARTTRFNETLKRNAAIQQLPQLQNEGKLIQDKVQLKVRTLRLTKTVVYHKLQPQDMFCVSINIEFLNLNVDIFAAIDAPLFKVCGRCGELANATSAVRKLYEPATEFFSPLRNEHGVVEVIDAGLVDECADEKTFIWLYDRCYRALRARKTPKFSRCSGFRIGCVPEETLCLNRIEARLIGLAVSFTTCVNLYRDGQEFIRGNAINYWSEPGWIVQELPRPVRACGVVFLATSADKTTKYFRVRPDLVRRAFALVD